jgi:hypothetical protein
MELVFFCLFYLKGKDHIGMPGHRWTDVLMRSGVDWTGREGFLPLEPFGL